MELGYAATLDYTACYDMMPPEVTCALLKLVEWRPDLVDLMEDTWSNMQRWLSWERHTAEEKLAAGDAMAQGDPWGPMVLNVWMGAGVRAVQKKRTELAASRATTTRRTRTRKKEPTIRTTVYMDDWSWPANSAEQTVQEAIRWQKWSKEVRLCENAGKTQIACKWPAGTPQHEELLQVAARHGMHSKVRQTLEVLGAESQTTNGKSEAKKGGQLIEAAVTTLTWIAQLPVGAARRAAYARTFALSKAAYGWVAKAPGCRQIRRIISATQRAFGRAGGGSRHLTAMIEGGTLDLDIVVGARALSLARTRMQREGNECYTGWKKTRGTLCGRLRPWMQRTGWQEDAYTAWKWHHAGIGATLDLANQEKREVAHLARKAWRESHWRRFLRGRRKDAAIASQRGTHYPTALVKVARQWMKHPTLFLVGIRVVQEPAALGCGPARQVCEHVPTLRG